MPKAHAPLARLDQVDLVDRSGRQVHRVRRRGVERPVKAAVRPAHAQPDAGWVRRRRQCERAERKRSRIRIRQLRDPDQIGGTGTRRESERRAPVLVSPPALNRKKLRALLLIDVDGRVEVPVRGELDPDPALGARSPTASVYHTEPAVGAQPGGRLVELSRGAHRCAANVLGQRRQADRVGAVVVGRCVGEAGRRGCRGWDPERDRRQRERQRPSGLRGDALRTDWFEHGGSSPVSVAAQIALGMRCLSAIARSGEAEPHAPSVTTHPHAITGLTQATLQHWAAPSFAFGRWSPLGALAFGPGRELSHTHRAAAVPPRGASRVRGLGLGANRAFARANLEPRGGAATGRGRGEATSWPCRAAASARARARCGRSARRAAPRSARPMPNSLITRSPPRMKAPNTSTMIAAAAVIVRPVAARPWVTASRLSPRLCHSS